jgi:hypothetical protein
MVRSLSLCLLAVVLAPLDCAPSPGSASDAGDPEEQHAAPTFTFIYAMALGRDCFMMGDCGYRLVLSPDGTLRRFNDRDEETASVDLSPEERAVLLGQLEAGGFFELPARLPDVPEGEMPLGGRVVTMTFERADGTRSHQVESHTDGLTVPLPESFYALDEVVRTYLLDHLGG